MSNGGDGAYVYDFHSIDQMNVQITQFCGNMDTRLEEVHKRFQTLIANGWKGMSSQAFEEVAAKWKTDAETVRQQLMSLATAVRNSWDSFQGADASAAGLF